MSAPFRELFVELPRAVFEVLRGIGEEALRGAGGVANMDSAADMFKAAYAPRPQRSSLFSHRCIRLVLQRYNNWTHAEIERAVDEDALDLVVFPECPHWQRYRFHASEIAACRGPEDEIDLLDRVVGSTERRCYCVQREEFGA